MGGERYPRLVEAAVVGPAHMPCRAAAAADAFSADVLEGAWTETHATNTAHLCSRASLSTCFRGPVVIPSMA